MATLVKPENVVFSRSHFFTETSTHYCPGCTHGIAHRLIAETIDEMHIGEHTIGVAPVGCSVFAYNYFNTDFVEAAHGRAPAMATGIKRVLPDRCVFTYQGDGDLASIGMAEIMHAAGRGERWCGLHHHPEVSPGEGREDALPERPPEHHRHRGRSAPLAV